MNRFGVLSAVVLGAAALVGCGPPYTVMRATEPNPFVNQRSFAVLPVEFVGLRVGEKSEAEYLADKDAESQEKWRGDKVGINEEYAKSLIEHAGEAGIRVALATGPGSAPFLVRPTIQFIEPGYYVGVSAGSSEIYMTVQVLAGDGRLLDEIVVKHKTGGSLTAPGIGNRLRRDGEALGKYTAEYLEKRVGVGG